MINNYPYYTEIGKRIFVSGIAKMTITRWGLPNEQLV